MSSRKRRSTTNSTSAEQVQPKGNSSATEQIPLLARLTPLLLPALLIVLTIIAFGQVFSCGFIEAYDDDGFVTGNSMVTQGLTWHGIKWSLTSFVTGNWHPLTWWSHMADVSLFGLNPTGHHATSLILHIINTILLYYFLFRTTGFRGRSFLVAILFAIHPLHVESVAWIAERKDLLSTAAGLMAMHLYITWVRTGRRGFYLGMVTLFCLSLMAKPMLVTLPFLLLVLDYWPLARFRERSFPALVREKAPLLLPVLAISVVTFLAQKSVGAMVTRSALARMYSALESYLVYLRKFLVPHALSPFYPYVPVSTARALLAALVLTAVSYGVWHYRHRSPWLATGWLWFLGLLVPVIGIVSVGFQAYADRYTYLPAVGLCIMAVWSGAELLSKAGFSGPSRAICAAAVIIGCTVVTWKQVGYWKDGFSLYGRELETVAGNWHAHFNLGTMLVDRQRYDEGIGHYRQALLNHPLSEAYIYHNLGVAYERKGDVSQAEENFRSTIRLSPALDKGYLGLARVSTSKGDMEGALGVIREGLKNVPDDSLLLAKEAYLLHKVGNMDAAVAAYGQAILHAPYLEANYLNLAILLRQQGKMEEFAALVNKLRNVNPAAADDLQR